MEYETAEIAGAFARLDDADSDGRRVARVYGPEALMGFGGRIKRNVADKWLSDCVRISSQMAEHQCQTVREGLQREASGSPVQSLPSQHALGHPIRPTPVGTVRLLPQLRGGGAGCRVWVRPVEHINLWKQIHGGDDADKAVEGMVELAASKDEPSTPEIMSQQYQPTTEVNQNVSIVKSNAKPKARRPTLKSKDISSGSRILVIPDTQVKPGVNTDHLEWAGHYAVKMKPDVIVHIGDHWDMPSLSSYDKNQTTARWRASGTSRTSTQVTRPWIASWRRYMPRWPATEEGQAQGVEPATGLHHGQP